MRNLLLAATAAACAWMPAASALVGDGATPPAPDVELRLAQPGVRPGQTAELVWHSADTERCVASGAWSGSVPPSGSRSVGPLYRNTTFTLTCSGAAGSALAMVSVDVLGHAELEWSRPGSNANGSELADLAGYRIYYGKHPGEYDGVQEISNPNVTSSDLELPVGSYYVAVTAVDSQGNESPRSQEMVARVR